MKYQCCFYLEVNCNDIDACYLQLGEERGIKNEIHHEFLNDDFNLLL